MQAQILVSHAPLGRTAIVTHLTLNLAGALILAREGQVSTQTAMMALLNLKALAKFVILATTALVAQLQDFAQLVTFVQLQAHPSQILSVSQDTTVPMVLLP
jgi:hypothetical protein